MSFAVFQQATRSSAIDACLFASFTSSDATNLILNKGNVLEVYDVGRRRNRLVLAADIQLFGRAEAVAAFRPRPGSAENLVLVFRRASYLVVLQYDPEFGCVRSCAQHMLITPADPSWSSGPAGFQAQIAVDPQDRCLLVRVLPDRVVVFPVSSEANWQRDAGPAVSQHGDLAFHQDAIHPPGLGAPFIFTAWTPLRLHHIEDIALLPGYHQPAAACLGQVKPGWGGCTVDSNKGNCSVLIVTLDLAEQAPQLMWAMRGLPRDAFRVLPLQTPVGGVLVLSNNAMVYLREHGPSFCQTLNPAAGTGEEYSRLGITVKDESKFGIALSGCCAVVLSPTVVLVSIQDTGRLYLAHMVVREDVTDIIWTSPGTAPSARALCAYGEEYLFLVAASGGSSLLKIQPSKKKLPPDQLKKRPRLNGTDVNGEASNGKPEASQELKALLKLHESLQSEARRLRSYSLVVVDEMESLGAIRCLALWRRDTAEGEEEEEDADAEAPCGTQRFICCSGTGSRGCLDIVQRAIPLQTLTEFDLPAGFSAAWTLQQAPEAPLLAEVPSSTPPPSSAPGKRSVAAVNAGVEEELTPGIQEDASSLALAAASSSAAAAAGAVGGKATPHRYVLASAPSRSMVLEATEEIEEISNSTPLDVGAATVCAGSALKAELVVQVTPERMCFMWAASPKSRDGLPEPVVFEKPPAEAPEVEAELPAKVIVDGSAPLAIKDMEVPQACGGCVCDPFVAVRFHDLALRLFLVSAPAHVQDVSERLPQAARRSVKSATFFQGAGNEVLLVILTTDCRGTLKVIDTREMTQVFHVEHLADVPPVLRAFRANRTTEQGCDLDHFRPLTDTCAHLPRGRAEMLQQKLGIDALWAELVKVDEEDRGPTLVVLVLNRPVLVYRAFMPDPTKAGTVFPYHFTLVTHDFVGIIDAVPSAPYRPVVSFRHPSGLSGAVVAPPKPGIPALWLAARRNKLFVHPLPGVNVRAFAPLHAACCEGGFFALSQGASGAVVAQVHTMGTVGGLPEDKASFELRSPIPFVRRKLERAPQCLATRPEDDMIALAVSEPVLETSDAPAGPSVDEDPLGEDWSIIRDPPVEATPATLPRLQSRYELWIDSMKELFKLGRYRFSFDTGEHVLCLCWVTLPGFPSPSLAVGTGVNTGEDLTCRGRLLVFSIKDREPGVVPAMYQRALKAPVTVISQWGNYLVHSEGWKLFFERWENTNFNKAALFDGSTCITAMSSIKNFLLCGDLRKGVEFVQWKEDTLEQTRNLRRLSRSPPLSFMTVLACDFIVCHKSLGLVAVDNVGSVHLFQYSPHSDGREGDQLLRSCATFSMGFPCRAALRLQTEAGVQCLFMASSGAEFLCLKPIDDQVFRTVTTLLGMLTTRLPFCGGLNPRALRHHDGPPALIAPRKNIEDGVLLRVFPFLSAPIQASIVEKMRLPLVSLYQATMPAAECQLFALRPIVAPGKSGAAGGAGGGVAAPAAAGR